MFCWCTLTWLGIFNIENLGGNAVFGYYFVKQVLGVDLCVVAGGYLNQAKDLSGTINVPKYKESKKNIWVWVGWWEILNVRIAIFACSFMILNLSCKGLTMGFSLELLHLVDIVHIVFHLVQNWKGFCWDYVAKIVFNLKNQHKSVTYIEISIESRLSSPCSAKVDSSLRLPWFMLNKQTLFVVR